MESWRPEPFYRSGRRPDGKPDVRLIVREHAFVLRCNTCSKSIMATSEGRAADRDDLEEMLKRTYQHKCEPTDDVD